MVVETAEGGDDSGETPHEHAVPGAPMQDGRGTGQAAAATDHSDFPLGPGIKEQDYTGYFDTFDRLPHGGHLVAAPARELHEPDTTQGAMCYNGAWRQLHPPRQPDRENELEADTPYTPYTPHTSFTPLTP